jgi:hypothetical protein
MARHKLTKEQQIRGCRKALANPKTPKQFVPGLKKRLKKLLAVLAFAICLPAVSHAQFNGYTSPQSVQQVLATNVACTGSAQSFIAPNLGQTQHFVSVTPANTSILFIRIFGQDVNGNNIQISDSIFPGGSLFGTTVLNGSGYFPKIVIIVTCSPVATGSFSLTYSGTSATPNVNAGSYALNQIDKAVFTSAPENASIGSSTFTTPFGSSSGKLAFQYVTAAIAGSSLTVTCQAQQVLSPISTTTFPLANVTTVQTFQMPISECPAAGVSYTTGGGGANTFNLDYVFDAPGQQGGGAGGAATQVQGCGAADAAAACNPVIVAGVDAAGNVQELPVSDGGVAAPTTFVIIGGVNVPGNAQGLHISTNGAIVTAETNAGLDNTSNANEGKLPDPSGLFARLAVDPYAFNGTTWDRTITCPNTSTFSVVSTTTQVIAASGSTKIRICSFDINPATVTAGTTDIVYGTGANCGTGTTTLTGAYTLPAAAVVDITPSTLSASSPLTTPASQAVCVRAVTSTVNGFIVWEQH